MLLSLSEAGQDIALALLNRHRGRLWLGESGRPALDAAYIEHNGLLLDRTRPELLAPCLRSLAQGRRIVLSGVNTEHLNAARQTGAVLRLARSQPAAFIDLSRLAPGPEGFAQSLSASTRYQLRRSAKRYAEQGPLTLHRATTVHEAHAVLDDLARLHQITWTARGKPGAFANPSFLRFHHALIATALPRGEIDLLRITAGPRLIGCLYNFRHNGHALAYQSGFDYETTHPHQKPGLTCHHLAIEQARTDGLTRYDFLAGDSRYKTSLANDKTMLHWFDLLPPWSLAGLIARLTAPAAAPGSPPPAAPGAHSRASS